MRSTLLFQAILCASLWASPCVLAQELPSLESAAEKLQAATVTLRVSPPAGAENQEPAKISVFSAVSLGDGLLVTPLFENERSQVRVTLPGGGQALAEPLVLDEHSGLALLQMDQKTAPGVTLAEKSPRAGSWVVSAAGWGDEDALVSVGVVSGVDRSLPGASYPPLLQLDLRTASTSSGAGLVNVQGELLGLIVATGEPSNQRGWTYAIPAEQIRRVVRAFRSRPAEQDGVMVIQRRRPVVGMMLTGRAEGVHIDRLTDGGPAASAGLQIGDEILAVEGVQVRSVYQAVRPLLFKQPGDTIDYLVQQEAGQKTITVALGGGVVIQGAPRVKLSGYFQPKILVEGRPLRAGHLAEVGAEPNPPAAVPPDENSSDSQKIAILQKALDGYRSAIVHMQGQLIRQQQDREKTQALIEKLEGEIESLRKKLPPSN
ncbi:S1C family serine protease [Lignipirellula cremea]|nr:S1C family serine protease [Lignipirellula cremea]